MRKEAKVTQNVQVAGIQGYHQGGAWGGQSYAFAGFSKNYYFNSDRKIELDSDWHRVDGQPMQGYGVEIETECNGIVTSAVLAEVYRKIIFPCFKFGNDMFKMQEDGSLGGRTSAEVITQVMTKSRIRNDYAAYKTMYNVYFPAFKISADSAHTSCGMHVNVSLACFGKTKEAQDKAIRKLYYIVNKHFDFCKKLFYRAGSTHWCGQMDYSRARTMDLEYQPNDHGKCMNLSHYGAGRIEIRLVGGQKNFACFRNTMESVFHLVERVRSLSWTDCDNLVKIFEGCNQYVYDRLTICGLSAEQLNAIAATVKQEDLL